MALILLDPKPKKFRSRPNVWRSKMPFLTKNNNKAIVFLFLFLLVPSIALASYHYVREGAAGGSNGSDWTNAWRSLGDIKWSSVSRGDTIYIADGTYTGATFDKPTSGTTYITIRKACSVGIGDGDHGTETGWSAKYGDGQAVLTGGLRFATSYWIFDGVYRTNITPPWDSGRYGFKVQWSGHGVYPACGDSHAVVGIESSHVTFKYTEVEGNGTNSGYDEDGIQICGTQGSHNTIQYCYIHDLGRCSFWIRDQDDLLMQYNMLYRCDSDASEHAEHISISCNVNRWTFRYNWLKDNDGTAFIATAGEVPNKSCCESTDWWIYGNVFNMSESTDRYGTTDGVISFFDISFDARPNDIYIINNSIVNLDGLYSCGISWGLGYPTDGYNRYIHNNLWYDCDVDADVPSCTGVDNDCLYSHNAYFRTNLKGSETKKYESSANPFNDSFNEDYTLTATAASNMTAGKTIPNVPGQTFNLDILGNIRGADGKWDRGAFEHVPDAVDYDPPAPPKGLLILSAR
jgi:hypothetical protein